MRIRACWSCGTTTPDCTEWCQCAKCVDPEGYADWRNNHPEEYSDWLESQRLEDWEDD